MVYYPLLATMHTRKISDDFINRHFPLGVPDNLWLYKGDDQKAELMIEHYEIQEDEEGKYVIEYKATRMDYTSIFDPESFFYGELCKIETDCNFDSSDSYSFGFGVYNKENAIRYGTESDVGYYRLVKVKVYLKDLAYLPSGKIRCSKLEIIDINPSW
jgi:hypothetical protein